MKGLKIRRYRLASEFSIFPGGRLRIHGPYSGEEFREDVLLPIFKDADKVHIDLSGAVGYGASFLDEAFGELGKIFGFDEVHRKLELLAEDDPDLVPLIWMKIKLASDEGTRR